MGMFWAKKADHELLCPAEASGQVHLGVVDRLDEFGKKVIKSGLLWTIISSLLWHLVLPRSPAHAIITVGQVYGVRMKTVG